MNLLESVTCEKWKDAGIDLERAGGVFVSTQTTLNDTTDGSNESHDVENKNHGWVK